MVSLWCTHLTMRKTPPRCHSPRRVTAHPRRTPMSTGTQAIDRAAELLSAASCSRTSRRPSASSSPTPASPSRPRPGCSRPSNGTGWCIATTRVGTPPAPLFALYASRHEPLDELIHAGPADHCRSSATPPARPSTSRSPAATPSSRSRRSTRRSCSARSTGSTSTCPPHCSALGKVFYADGALELPTRGPRTAYRPHTITDPADLARQLGQVRAQGYAVTLGELEIGLDAIAAPVHGRGGEVIAALGISGPSRPDQPPARRRSASC